MKLERNLFVEKLEVQITSIAIVTVSYFAIWPRLQGLDRGGALSFLMTSGMRGTWIFILLFLLFAGICALLTIPGRREGALVAALIGVGGLSMRSPQIRSLLWANMETPGHLFVTLMLETLMLAAVLAATWILVTLIRRAICSAIPKAFCRGLLCCSDDAADAQPDASGQNWQQSLATLLGLRANVPPTDTSRGDSQPASANGEASKSSRSVGQQVLACLALQLVIAVVLLWLLMRSDDRGQILFALVASFFLASVIANHKFPTPYALAGWVLPIVLAICFYTLGAVSSVGGPPQGWIEVSALARALPIDWLTAGCGGSILGYWVSSRGRDLHRVHQLEEEQEA